ncbi:hypothetical protein [Halococcus sediminicola]|uniref:hypothetical protein n=1 Tax=Halococcus sediminicola TaxID=1264579 RepID=UPI000ACAC08A|nr:hypothetical protein [Halococcus sediminicola]
MSSIHGVDAGDSGRHPRLAAHRFVAKREHGGGYGTLTNALGDDWRTPFIPTPIAFTRV